MIEIWRENSEYVAWARECLVMGFGDTPQEARAALLANVAGQYQCLNDLGLDRISRHLAETIPALVRLLALDAPITK